MLGPEGMSGPHRQQHGGEIHQPLGADRQQVAAGLERICSASECTTLITFRRILLSRMNPLVGATPASNTMDADAPKRLKDLVGLTLGAPEFQRR
jgi:hypothetical protein